MSKYERGRSRRIALPRCDFGRKPESPEERRLFLKVSTAIDRCYNEHHPAFHRYGGRGVRVLKGWCREPISFVGYLKTLQGWADPSLQLSRVDCSGHYVPGNLAFVSQGSAIRTLKRRSRPPVHSIQDLLELRGARRDARLVELKSGEEELLCVDAQELLELRLQERRILEAEAEAMSPLELRSELTQAEVAEASDLFQTQISLYENRRYDKLSSNAMRKLNNFYRLLGS